MKGEEIRLGRILNGTGTGKVRLKYYTAIQRWFESTRLALLFFFAKFTTAIMEKQLAQLVERRYN